MKPCAMFFGCTPNPSSVLSRTVNIGVVQFPGSNADWDALHAFRDVLGAHARYVFHKETSLEDVDFVVLPGGFSYGDYLRPGAIARFSPIAPALIEFARRGGPVLGICNGFQILVELGLLPGALTRNAHLRFECRDVFVRVDGHGMFTNHLEIGSVLRLPIAHADGRYVCEEGTLRLLNSNRQVAFRYCAGPNGDGLGDANPNGSMEDIAGIYNEQRNVLGMMPHPERASEAILNNEHGRKLLEGFVRSRAA